MLLAVSIMEKVDPAIVKGFITMPFIKYPLCANRKKKFNKRVHLKGLMKTGRNEHVRLIFCIDI